MQNWNILDPNGAPLLDAVLLVKTNHQPAQNQTAKTNAAGCASLQTVTDCLVAVQKNGYFDRLLPPQGGTYTMYPATDWEAEVINDETLEQRIVYSENWQYYNAYPGDQAIADVRKNQVLYNTDAHGTKCSGETATLAFSGKNLRVFVLADSYGGDASITIDDGAPIPVSFYRPRLTEAQGIGERLQSFVDNATEKNTNNSKAYHLLYETYDLADTDHTMVLRTGNTPTEDASVCRAVLDFIDLSERPVFNRFNFAPYYISEITKDSALATQCIMAKGKYPITQAGFVSSAKGMPTIADIITYATPAADGTLCATITGLAPYTRYSTRAFAVANGTVYYGHETTNFRTMGSVTLSHELYGGFPEEEFELSVINQEKQLHWVCETLVHPTAKVALAPEKILQITPTEHGVLVSLLQEGNVLVKAMDATTGALCAACDVTVARAQKSPLAKTPPMGWNSWNCFLRKVNVNNITETLETMAKPITKDGKSLKDLGYSTCVIDGGWRENFLDESGGMIPSVLMGGKDGIRQMAQKAAGMGISLGLHISPGDRDCMSQPIGAKWNESTHYQQFYDWGLTFLKIDQCDYRPYHYNDIYDYARWMYLRHKYFMDNSGGETVYSISNYHFDGWQHQAAHMWRISGDIATSENTANPCGARWNTPGQFASIYECANFSNRSADFARQGAWNDAEMCVVGDPGISDIEGASQFNLWCIMASPLMLGNDLRTMCERTIEIITNEEAIAVNQDMMGVQGRRIWKKTPDGQQAFETAPALELWAKPLADGSFAALLLNNTEAETSGISFAFESLCFTNEVTDDIYVIKGKTFALRDLDHHTDLGQFSGTYTSQPLAAHESVLLKVTPVY